MTMGSLDMGSIPISPANGMRSPGSVWEVD